MDTTFKKLIPQESHARTAGDSNPDSKSLDLGYWEHQTWIAGTQKLASMRLELG